MKLQIQWEKFPREKISSIRDAIEFVGVWFACLLGLVLSSTAYLMLNIKTKKKVCSFSPQSYANETISIIVAAYNEGHRLQELITEFCSKLKDPTRAELIVVNPSSTDNTTKVLGKLKCSLPLKIVTTPSGRGIANHKGALAASGEVLLFLHADIGVPYGYDELVREEIGKAQVIATSFRFEVNRDELNGKHLIGLNTMEACANFRAFNFQLPYGDQGIGIAREEYAKCGGFPDVKMMEDFELIAKLRKQAVSEGRYISILPVSSVCSPRRWIKNGVLKNTLLNQGFVMAYVYLGWSPEKIYRYYYGTD